MYLAALTKDGIQIEARENSEIVFSRDGVILLRIHQLQLVKALEMLGVIAERSR